MRKAMLLLAFFGLAGSLWAADPIIGSWKLIVAKSKIQPSETAPKEATDAYKEIEGDQIEFTRTGTQVDGAPIFSKWRWPCIGGTAERVSPEPLPEEMSYIELLVDPGYWYVTILQNGKQNSLMQKTISKDGKTMRIRIQSRDAQGKLVEELHVFEKQ
jgi:hypothetical protein